MKLSLGLAEGAGMPRALAIVGLASMVFSPLSVWSDSTAPASPRSVTLGHILEDDLRSLPYECECEFFAGPTRGGNTVFATRKNRAVAFVKVDGQLFTVQRSGPPANAVCRKGTPYRERWVGQGTVIYIDQRATRSGAESCWYNGTMRVVVGERSMLTPIGGACGC
jgi:hypothetical protein